MSVEAVCFDLDDTLFDYHRYARAGLRAAADHLTARTGLELHDELVELYFEQGVTSGTFDRVIDRHDLSPELVDELVESFHGASVPLSPYPEAESVLARLGETYRLGLVTDGRGGHEKLRRLGLEGYFDAVLVTPTIDSSKHEPAVFRRVLSTLDVAPEATVYVGDDVRVDFRVPNDLGMRTVRLRRGRYSDLDPESGADAPDEEIDSLAQLPELVERSAPLDSS